MESKGETEFYLLSEETRADSEDRHDYSFLPPTPSTTSYLESASD